MKVLFGFVLTIVLSPTLIAVTASTLGVNVNDNAWVAAVLVTFFGLFIAVLPLALVVIDDD